MKKTLYALACFLTTAVLFVSCSKSTDSASHIPFMADEDEGWGLISPDGDVLFSDEFKTAPTYVYNDRFFVRNNSGEYDLYTAEKTPEKLGGGYTGITDFSQGVAVVCTNKGKLELIDKDGNTIKSLDKLDGKDIQDVYQFYGMCSAFRTTDSTVGVIDTEGNVVITPDYASLFFAKDKYVAVDKKYIDDINSNDFSSLKIKILDSKGEVLSELAMRNKQITGVTPDCKICYRNTKTERAGIMDEDGNDILKSSKYNYEYIFPARYYSKYIDGRFIAVSDDNWGIIDSEGKVIVRLKYSTLYFVGTNLLEARKDGYRGNAYLIDLEGNTVGEKDGYSDIIVLEFDKYYAVQESSDEWRIIDAKGEYVNKTRYYKFANNYSSTYVSRSAANENNDMYEGEQTAETYETVEDYVVEEVDSIAYVESWE